MIFSSIGFLFYFLPVVIALYFLSPKSLKNYVLLASSLVFYGWGEPRYVFLMLATVFAAYVFGLLIERFKSTKAALLFMILSVASSLAGLLYFKYADFFIANFNLVTGLSLPLLKITLPIGISFYTFQIISYTIDVYRGSVGAQKNPLYLATYVALFPQLIAGPIVRYSDIEKQLTQRRHTIDKISDGCRRFIIGLAKKIIIANTLGELCDAFVSSSELSVLFYWLFAFSYMLQIYFDFSGYSDMAIGLGKIFGFDFHENFNYPFVSSSITEFWRRWHISLGSWFRDYVYIPLGGNRKGAAWQLFNIFAVWFLTGFWHGAEWNFVLWGLYFGTVLTLEKFFLLDFLKKHRIFSHFYTLFFVAVSFVIFAAPNLRAAVSSVGAMFGGGELPPVSAEFVYSLRNYGFVLIAAALGATPLIKKTKETVFTKSKTRALADISEIIILAAFIVICAAYLADGSFNPFLYFRF